MVLIVDARICERERNYRPIILGFAEMIVNVEMFCQVNFDEDQKRVDAYFPKDTDSPYSQYLNSGMIAAFYAVSNKNSQHPEGTVNAGNKVR